jgi:lipoprotein-anchoring transpeptidase ErfK/SrfK
MIKKNWIFSVVTSFCALAILATACNDGQNNSAGEPGATTNTTGGNPSDTFATMLQVALIIDTSDKQLMVVKGTDTLKKYTIAVGTAKYPTPVGSFTIHQIDFNPDWTPPEGDWAKKKKYEKPGSKANPMGRARIIYEMPYTIHGTRDLASLGESDSHGSVRMANADVLDLARLIMTESGTEKPESWYQQVLSDSTKMESVKLERNIPLTNRD